MLTLFKICGIILIVLCCLPTCNKKEFLDKNPSSRIVVPKTLDDFQALLDNHAILSETPVLGELSADNYYLLMPFWQALKDHERNIYTWQHEIFRSDEHIGDWEKPYQQVFYANVVLDGLPPVPQESNEVLRWNQIKGIALFIRAYAFYNLAQLFCPFFDENITPSENEFGIPLPLKPNIKATLKRANLTDTYNRIIIDLSEAIRLLPDALPAEFLNRPSKPAAYALMARIYLSIRSYDKALKYADSSLNLYNTLIDYNEVSTTRALPFGRLNEETLYQSTMLTTTNVLKALVVPSCIADSNLYRSYDINDLRRYIFFGGTADLPTLKGGYNGTIFLFSGLATDELYLIKAECLARSGAFQESMNVLNTLLEKRYKTGTFMPLTASDEEAALELILNERRKELPFRGLRWSDLRRLNKEGYNITLQRKLDKNYILPPNDRRYVLPIPHTVLNLNGNITQYPRN
jgi:tetratricopeptide (TPR) repeat protein